VKVHAGWDASEVLRRFGRALHVHWSELYAGARDAGEVELDGRTFRRIELTPRMLVPVDPRLAETPAPPADVLLLDAQTKLPARLTVHTRGPDGGPTTAETRLDDWREVAGHRFPHRVELRASGFVLLLEYERYEVDVELPAGFFAPGDEVLAAQAEEDAAGGLLRDGEVRRMTLNERPIASIRMKCKHDEIQKTLSVLLPEVLAHVVSTGAEKTGPPLVRYHSMPAEEIDLEAAIPVREPVEPGGRVKACALPAGEAAVTWHVGPYQELGKAYERLQAWMSEHGYEPAGAPWEEYWTDPGLEPDPSKWRTRVVWPVRAARDGDGEAGEGGSGGVGEGDRPR
jgi:effector-binding domain-containing protein